MLDSERLTSALPEVDGVHEGTMECAVADRMPFSRSVVLVVIGTGMSVLGGRQDGVGRNAHGQRMMGYMVFVV